jgi:hypothetical protein
MTPTVRAIAPANAIREFLHIGMADCKVEKWKKWKKWKSK